MLKYCTVHGIGYESTLDPVCPQCSLSRMAPAQALSVDLNPASAGFGYPIPAGELEGSKELPKIRG